jgi:transcription elongation factor GreA
MATKKLSRATYQRLEDELEDLNTRGRIEIARDVEGARVLGRVSQSWEYPAVKDAQGKLFSRIRWLESMLRDAEVVDSVVASENVVVGVIVELRYVGDDEVESYLVGSVEEAGTSVISPGSPLGQAIMGRRAGDKVSYEAPVGQLQVEILSIS